jgi:hypothetical protein
MHTIDNNILTLGPVVVAVASIAENGQPWGVALAVPKTDGGWTLDEILERAQTVGMTSGVINECARRVTVDVHFPSAQRR